MTERLRLRAVDADDLSVIAACLQDALVPLSEMAYLPDQRRFMAAFTAKGRYAEIMRAMPVQVILNPKTSLLGAAHAARELLDR